MEYLPRTRSLQSLVNDVRKGKIVLEHKLQRPEGQWNRRQKVDLIDSILKYPINPTSGVRDGSKIAVIDGVQRLATLRDYLDDAFAMPKDWEDERFAGRKFSKLDSEVQDAINNTELMFYEIITYTDKEVREMFRRQNAGKPLTYKLLRVVYGTDAFNEKVAKLVNHPFMKKFVTSAQHKNGTDREIIVQTLMLLETDEENDYTSFRKADVDNFVKSHDDISEDIIAGITKVMNVCDNNFDKLNLAVSAKPMVLYVGYKLIVNSQQTNKFLNVIKEFMEHGEADESYKKYTKSDTTSSTNVRGRLAYWNELIA